MHKKRMFHKKNSLRILVFYLSKKITNLVCGKYLVETFGFAFMSKTEFPF